MGGGGGGARVRSKDWGQKKERKKKQTKDVQKERRTGGAGLMGGSRSNEGSNDILVWLLWYCWPLYISKS